MLLVKVSFTFDQALEERWYYRLLERYCTKVGKDSNIHRPGSADRVSVSGQSLHIASSTTYWPPKGLATAVVGAWLQFVSACGSVGDAPFGAGRLTRSCRRTRAARGRLTESRIGSVELIPPPAERVTMWAG